MMCRIELEDPRDYLISRDGGGKTVEIYDIVVGSERRTGKGRLLVDRLIKNHETDGTRLIWAITRSTNFISQLFYESLNFRVVGVLRDFYRDVPELAHSTDAIMYGRDL